MNNMEEMTVVQLRLKAKELGFKNISKLKKNEIVDLLEEYVDNKKVNNDEAKKEEIVPSKNTVQNISPQTTPTTTHLSK